MAGGWNRTAMAAGIVATCGGAFASGGPENVLLLVDPSSAASMYVGNYYKAARGIPDANVLYVDPDAPSFAALAEGNLDAVFGTLANRGITDHVDFIVLTPGSGFYIPAAGLVSDSCFAVNRCSTTAGYSLLFITDKVLSGVMSTRKNRYFGTNDEARAFDSSITWRNGVPDQAAGSETYFIGAMLGYIGERGSTIDEVLAMIDTSVGADGLRPAGRFYFMNNAMDEARNVRQIQFAEAIASITNLGGQAEEIDNVLPGGRNNCLGIMTGAANPGIAAGNFTILPGAFCDHLTSWAAAFDIDAQRKVSAWIAKGAVGSAGTVEEPCNYPGKFPHARLHVWYYQGLTVGEAYLRSLEYMPFQNLFVGDPLTRAFAYIPVVTLADAPGEPVSGTITLTPGATTDHPTADIAGFDLLVDGRLLGSVTPGQFFSLDTRVLDDGWHDVRVLAYDDTLARSVGAWTGSITTDNHGLGATIAAMPSSGDLNTIFTFDANGTGAVRHEIRVIQNGRVIAATRARNLLAVYGQTLGAGRSTVRAEVEFANGRIARSAPIEVDVAFESGTPSGVPPVAFGYDKHVLADQPFVVELPATFDDDPAGATYTLLSNPAQATVAPTPTGAFRVMTPIAGASGSDQFTFRVQTPSGQSAVATVVLFYGAACEADCDADGICDADEIAGGAPDCNGNGIPDHCDVDPDLGGESEDCQPNGVPDECELADGSSHDCNQNLVPDECEPGFCAADLAPPFGVLNIFDFLAFQTAFGDAGTCADLAPPIGVLNIFDFLAYQTAFGDGCP